MEPCACAAKSRISFHCRGRAPARAAPASSVQIIVPSGLRHDGLGPDGGQDAEAFLVRRLQRLRRARGLCQRHGAHGGGIEAEAVIGTSNNPIFTAR